MAEIRDTAICLLKSMMDTSLACLVWRTKFQEV